MAEHLDTGAGDGIAENPNLGSADNAQDLDAIAPSEALQEITEVSHSLFTQAESFVSSLFRTWNLYQVLIALGLLLLSLAIRKLLAPALHKWMRSREGWPKWRLRWLLVIHKRLGGIVFVVLIWTVLFIMREFTWPSPLSFHWPSRTYLLGIIATLATAWLVVRLATRLIHNPLMRQVVRYGAWIWVTVSILGITDETEKLLDSMSVDLGDTRLSVWLVVQAVFILGVFFFASRFLSRTVSA